MTLVNLHKVKREGVTVIDRTSPWGNPVALGRPCPRCERSHTRADDDGLAALVCYGEILLVKLDGEFAAQVQQLENQVLGCWCVPAPCHGEYLLAYLEAYSTRAGIASNGASQLEPRVVELAHAFGVRAVREHLEHLQARAAQTCFAWSNASD